MIDRLAELATVAAMSGFIPPVPAAPASSRAVFERTP